MRALVQRVSRAEVRVGDEVVGAIGRGLVILVGVTHGDGEAELDWLARKCAQLRVFPDEAGKMNRSVVDVGGAALVVSQFTLYADPAKGNRPSYVDAAAPEVAEPTIERFTRRLAELLDGRVATGRFRADMDVELVNEGPVTLWLAREPQGG